MSDPDATQPTLPPQGVPPPGATPTGYQRTQGGGVKWMPPTPEQLAAVLPQYHIEALIGRGGMGAVYRGRQKALDRLVAIKILPPEVDSEDASYTERFKNEAKIMARLEHPAIVPVYDFGETATGLLYFVMSFVDGTDIHQMIASQGRLPADHALAITAHVCDALAYAHKHGVVHRDIKPSNVLINMDGQVKVADFGLAKAQDNSQSSALTKTGLAMGTPDYVAPEALMLGVQTDGRADLYAVGVMLYQMLTGQVPRGAFDLPSKLAGCDPRFDQIVIKAMKYDREDRYPTAGDLRRDLDVILTAPLVQSGGQSSAAIPKAAMAQPPAPKGPPQPQQRPASAAPPPEPNHKSKIVNHKSKTPLLIGLAAAAAIAIGAFVMLGGKKNGAAPPPPPPVATKSPPPAKSTSTSTTVPAAKPPVASSPPLPVSKSSDQFPPGKWVKVFTKAEDLPEDLRRPGSSVKMESGWLKLDSSQKTTLLLPEALNHNYAVRASIRRNDTELDTENISLRLQPTTDGKSNGHYQFKFAKKNVLCQRRDADQYTSLFYSGGNIPAPAVGDTYTLEFGAVGNRLVGRFGTSFVQMATDSHWKTGSGRLVFASDLRDIEVINLDGLPEAEALKLLGVDDKGNDLRKTAPPTAATGEAWQDMLKDRTKLRLMGGAEVTPDGLIIASKAQVWPASLKPERDGAVRMTAVFQGARPQLQVRSKLAVYLADLTGPDRLELDRWDPAQQKSIRLREVSLKKPLAAGDTYELELRIVGSVLTVKYNGEVMATAEDSTLTEGKFGMATVETHSQPTVIKALHLLDLDAAPSVASATPAASSPAPAAAKSSTAPASSSPPLPVSKSETQFPPGQWVKLFTKAEDLPEDHRRPDSGVKFEDGWIRYQADKGRRLYVTDSFTNYAIRATMLHIGKEYSPKSLMIRATPIPGTDGYVLSVGTESFLYAARKVSGGSVDKEFLWKAFPPEVNMPLNGEEYTLEWGCVGDKLIGRAGKDFVKVITDSKWKTGPGFFTGGEPIRDIEVINLDGLPEAEALRLLGVDEKGNDLRALAAQQEQQKAEMAKAVDAMAAIPELKVLHDQLVQFTAERVTAPFDKDLAALNTSYLGGLDRKMTELKQKGDLDGVLALEAEKKLIADKQPMPAEDDATTAPTLKDLRKIYRDAHAKLVTTRATNLKALTDPLALRLKQLESTLTQANRIEHAKTVREYREGLGRADAPPSAANALPGANTPPNNDTAKTSNSPGDVVTKLSAREAVEWALSHKGQAEVEKSGVRSNIQSANQIPKGSFEVTKLDLSKASEPRSLITDAELETLASQKELKELLLQSRKGFDGRFLASFSGLRKLTYLNLAETILESAHLHLLSLIPSLVTLRINAAVINDHGDKLPKHLKTLGLHGPPSLELLTALRSYRELSDLKVINFALTTAHAEAIAQLENLNSLEIGFSEEPAVFTHLARLPRLNMLVLSSPGFNIQTLTGLKLMSQIERLRLNAETVQKDPAALATILADLKKLKLVELTTNPALAAKTAELQAILQKALPKLKVSVL